MGAAWTLTGRLEVLKSLVYASFKFCPFCKVVLSASGHQLCFGCPCRRFEFLLASDQLGMDDTKIERTELWANDQL
jgi:hypothetical protein